MKVTVVGSASGISMPGRGHACVALETGGSLYLLDLGEPVGRELLALGLPVERLKAAFVSHMHSDHVGGLFQFVKNLELYHNHPDYLPQVDSVTLGLPAEAVEPVKRFLPTLYAFQERMRVRVDYEPLAVGREWRDDAISLTPLRSTHLEHYGPFLAEHPEYDGPRGEAFSFDIRAEGKRVFYSADLGSVDDVIPAADGADLVVLEFGHLLPLEENLRRLAGRGIQRMILTHIFPDYTDRSAELQRIADDSMPGVVTVARDGLAMEL